MIDEALCLDKTVIRQPPAHDFTQKYQRSDAATRTFAPIKNAANLPHLMN